MHINQLFRKPDGPRTIKGSLFGDAPEQEAEGQWIGEVDKRSDFVLTLKNIIPLFEGYFVAILKFVDRDGNDVVWFAKADKEMSVGNTYHIRAKVKRHTTYKGRKQTQIYYITKYHLKFEAVHISTDVASSWDAI